MSGPAIPADRRFLITWHERTIGEHHVRFRQSESELEVRTRVDLTVKLAFITLYDLHHESEERWNGGRLTRLAAHTRENGAALSRLRGSLWYDSAGDWVAGRFDLRGETIEYCLAG